MATLNTFAQVDAELAATADYDIENDISKAKRRVAALRRKLDFVSSSTRDSQTMQFQQSEIRRQLQSAIDFVRGNQATTESQRLANPNVVHADFSQFRSNGG